MDEVAVSVEEVKEVVAKMPLASTSSIERLDITPAERRFKEIQMQRMRKTIEKKLEKGHR